MVLQLDVWIQAANVIKLLVFQRPDACGCWGILQDAGNPEASACDDVDVPTSPAT